MEYGGRGSLFSFCLFFGDEDILFEEIGGVCSIFVIHSYISFQAAECGTTSLLGLKRKQGHYS